MEMKILVVSLQLSSVKLYMTQCKLCKTFERLRVTNVFGACPILVQF